MTRSVPPAGSARTRLLAEVIATVAESEPRELSGVLDLLTLYAHHLDRARAEGAEGSALPFARFARDQEALDAAARSLAREGGTEALAPQALDRRG